MKCPYCHSEIPDQATKCRFCGEWQSPQNPRLQTAGPAVQTTQGNAAFATKAEESATFALVTLVCWLLLAPIGFLLNIVGLFTGPKRGCFMWMLGVFVAAPVLLVLVLILSGSAIGLELGRDPIGWAKNRYFTIREQMSTRENKIHYPPDLNPDEAEKSHSMPGVPEGRPPQMHISKSATGSATFPAQATDELIACYTFDNRSLADTGPLGHHATSPSGNPIFVDGVVGAGLSIRGGSDRMEVPFRAQLSPGVRPFSVSLWLKFPTVPQDDMPIFIGSNRPGGANWVSLYVKSGRLLFGMRSDRQTSQTEVLSPAPLSIEQWHHVCVTRNEGTLSIWIDGRKQGTQHNPILSNVDLVVRDSYEDLVTSDPFFIGYNPSYGGHPAILYLDEIRFYRRELLEGEIASLSHR